MAGAPARPRLSPHASSARELHEPAVQRDRGLEGGFPGLLPHVSTRQPYAKLLAPFLESRKYFHPQCFPAELPRGQKRGWEKQDH